MHGKREYIVYRNGIVLNLRFPTTADECHLYGIRIRTTQSVVMSIEINNYFQLQQCCCKPFDLLCPDCNAGLILDSVCPIKHLKDKIIHIDKM